ncbi:MAG: T9SS type A sorting domain-containing protein [Sporocytophaga sp.]|nr:T9SS type A sorting domain-containing protein [Sporocytophaga sp.]
MTNSINTPFYIESVVSVVSGYTVKLSSPSFLSPPIFHAEKNKTFTNNLSVYSPDKDSISYKLVTCKQARDVDVEGYFIPEEFKINPYSGQITWDKPSLEGLYNFAAMVEFWKNGAKVGYVIRDYQVTVNAEQLSGQVFEVTTSHEITPGNSVSLDPGDVFSMEVLFHDTANSVANLKYFGELQNEDGVFNITIEQVTSKARNSNTAVQSPMYKATVTMNVEEKYKRSTPYNLIFRGETGAFFDNISNDFTIQLYIGVPVPLGVNFKRAKGNLNLSFYPVPVKDQLTVKKESNDSGTLIIYNSEGRDVKSIYLSKGVVDTHFGIDLKSGTYIYNFNSDNGKEFSSGKFIVN